MLEAVFFGPTCVKTDWAFGDNYIGGAWRSNVDVSTRIYPSDQSVSHGVYQRTIISDPIASETFLVQTHGQDAASEKRQPDEFDSDHRTIDATAAVLAAATTTSAATYVPALQYYQLYQQHQELQRQGGVEVHQEKEEVSRSDLGSSATFFHQTSSTAVNMNGVDVSGLRGAREGYGGEDVTSAAVASVNNLLNGALGGAIVQQVNGNSLTGAGNDGYGLHHNTHLTDHSGGGGGAGASMGRSHSSSSSSGSSGTGDQATPPALQGSASAAAAAAANHHQLQAAMAHQMALSHYSPAASFGSLAAFNSHLRTAAAAGGPPSVGGNLRRYPCKLCPAMFDSKAELQIHTQVHMREAKPYKCSHCVKSFANSSYLSQHMRIHLNIKPFGPCQYCGRKFTQLSHLQQHLRTHTGEKPYKCRHPGCEKAFSQLSNLQSHSRCHQTDKPYKCNSCYKCFTDEPSLLEHIPKHKESKHLKVHICPYCGKSYTQATYLAKHMTKHSDRKPVKSATMVAAAVAAAAAASGVSTNGTGGAASSSSDIDHLWTSRAENQSMCAVHGIVDSCHADSTAAAGAISFNSFPAHNHIMQPQTCAYTPTGIASSMANMANVAAAAAAASNDPSAFTRLAGLAPLTRSLTTGSSRNPYFAYDNFKAAAATHTGGLSHPSAPYNQLIRLDDIRNYAGQAAAAEHFNNMLQIKRDPREAAY